MKITYDEEWAILQWPGEFTAGFKEAFNRFRKNDDPPVKDPCSWFRTAQIAAWSTGYKYGRYIQTLEENLARLESARAPAA